MKNNGGHMRATGKDKNNSGYVKITGGALKGRRIRTPGAGTHPMGERERIALFNMVLPYVGWARVLDLYSGGGTLAIEALSRGASSAALVEKNRGAIEVARENISALRLDACSLICEDAAGFTEDFRNDPFDLVLADPPYDKFNQEMTLNLEKLVKKGGILVLSHPGKAPEITDLTLLKTRKYAAAHLSIYVKD